MENRICAIHFLNPSKAFVSGIHKYFIVNDFKNIRTDEQSGIWRYKKENEFIYMALLEDSIGTYIVMNCEGVSIHKLKERLSVCPECGSCDLKVSIYHCWSNDITDQLLREGKLCYVPGAYDRYGTKPETKKCLRCGCKWHNGADVFYWNETIKRGGKLMKKELGIQDT